MKWELCKLNKMKQNGLGNKLFDRTRYQKCPLCVINGPQTKTIGTMRKGYVSYCGQKITAGKESGSV